MPRSHIRNATFSIMSSINHNSLPSSVGFIGLGAMGRPMVANLAAQLPASSNIYVHDVVPSAADEVRKLCASLSVTIINCPNAKEVAIKSVGILRQVLMCKDHKLIDGDFTGRRTDYAPRRRAR